MKRVKQSFTLVEILVVIVIIGILSSFIFFTVNDSVEKANLAKTKMFEEAIRNNLLMNLVAEWKMDDEDDLGFDSWGNNNGSDSNVGYESDCISGGCGVFNGTSSYINCNELGDLGSFFTYSAWFKSDDSGEYNMILNVDNDTIGNPQIRLHNKKVQMRFYSSGSLESVSDYDDGNWHLAVGGINNDGDFFLYIDGISEGTLTPSKLINWTGNTSIGRYIVSTSMYYFNGSIDEVKIYNAAIPESQIKQEYLAGLNNLYAKGLITQIEYNKRIAEL